jgi:hypothetical protein
LRVVDSTTLEGAQEFSFDIEDRTEKLNLIADWRDELKELMRADYHLAMTLDLDGLRIEVDRFKLACKGVRA